MTALKGPLTPPLHRKQGPQGLVQRPKDRGPRDKSVHGTGTKGHPAPTPSPGRKP
jgi:hypothetical protein